jgi:hypothetical protein
MSVDFEQRGAAWITQDDWDSQLDVRAAAGSWAFGRGMGMACRRPSRLYWRSRLPTVSTIQRVPSGATASAAAPQLLAPYWTPSGPARTADMTPVSSMLVVAGTAAAGVADDTSMTNNASSFCVCRSKPPATKRWPSGARRNSGRSERCGVTPNYGVSTDGVPIWTRYHVPWRMAKNDATSCPLYGFISPALQQA